MINNWEILFDTFSNNIFYILNCNYRLELYIFAKLNLIFYHFSWQYSGGQSSGGQSSGGQSSGQSYQSSGQSQSSGGQS